MGQVAKPVATHAFAMPLSMARTDGRTNGRTPHLPETSSVPYRAGEIDHSDAALMAEITEWRRTHTWGGYLWPGGEQRVDPRWLRSEELLDEAQWQLDMGVHPCWAAKAVGMSAVRLQRLAQRHNRPALARAFEAEIKYEKGRAA